VGWGWLLMLNWRDKAACKGMDVNLFFPKPVRDGVAPNYDPIVRETCGSCPVSQECYAEAKKNRNDGFWGNTTPTQRGFRIQDRSKANNTSKKALRSG